MGVGPAVGGGGDHDRQENSSLAALWVEVAHFAGTSGLKI
jgi:hypothetical protein